MSSCSPARCLVGDIQYWDPELREPGKTPNPGPGLLDFGPPFSVLKGIRDPFETFSDPKEPSSKVVLCGIVPRTRLQQR